MLRPLFSVSFLTSLALIGLAAIAGEPAKGVIIPPKPARFPYPPLPYPATAKNRGVEGVVVAEFVVLANGKVGEVRITNDAPALLADPVKAGLKAWNAGPPEAGDPPRPETRTARYEFRLSESRGEGKWPFVTLSEKRLKKLKILTTPDAFDIPPDWAHVAEPVYPTALPMPRANVTVQFDVGETGTVDNIGLPEQTPDSLAAAIRTALVRWKFTPASKDRQPVRVRIEFVFEFNRLP